MTSSPSASSTSSSSTAPSAAPKPGFRLGRVLMVVVPLAVLVLGGFYMFTYGDGVKWITGLFTPSMVKVTGQVFQGGEPLPGAQVRTKPVREGLKGSVGYCDAEGKFTLQTDIEGDFVEGAYAGEHIVTVQKAQMGMATASAPPMLTAAKYGSFKETPLHINIDASKPENHFELKLEGAAIKADQPPTPAPAQSQGPNFGTVMLRQTVTQLDKNSDGKLTAEEMKAAPGGLGEELTRADKNGDGELDSAEMTALTGGPGGGGPGGGGPGGGGRSRPAAETPAEGEPSTPPASGEGQTEGDAEAASGDAPAAPAPAEGDAPASEQPGQAPAPETPAP